MANNDILFHTPAGIFSYRVGGILIRDGKVLLQRPPGDPGYAIPGGHVSFGETSQDALAREFKEETGADIRLIRLFCVGENFFPWGEQRCHQIHLYFLVELCDETQIPVDRTFYAYDELEHQRVHLEFSWIPLASLDTITVYPMFLGEKLRHLTDGVELLVYRE
ncbi:MAG: NUDIX domain-containing protein [Chloroflexi bacterium]|nr:MAG: NUDIX domain-containing protein [Chloroflexota bacterium]